MSGASERPIKLESVDNKPTPPATEYLGANIPWWWITKARKCKGAELAVGIRLWHLSKLTGSDTVKFGAKDRKAVEVTSNALGRALDNLEALNLIRSDRTRGRCPVVTLVKSRVTLMVPVGR